MKNVDCAGLCTAMLNYSGNDIAFDSKYICVKNENIFKPKLERDSSENGFPCVFC